MGFCSGAWYWRQLAWPLSSIKADGLCPQVLHSLMSNIIPLPFESTLSTSYTDASELVQAMQHLEDHLAHILNIWVTSKCLAQQVFNLSLTTVPYRFAGVMACPFRGRELPNEGVNGLPGVGEPGDQGDDGAVVPCVQL